MNCVNCITCVIFVLYSYCLSVCPIYISDTLHIYSCNCKNILFPLVKLFRFVFRGQRWVVLLFSTSNGDTPDTCRGYYPELWPFSFILLNLIISSQEPRKGASILSDDSLSRNEEITSLCYKSSLTSEEQFQFWRQKSKSFYNFSWYFFINPTLLLRDLFLEIVYFLIRFLPGFDI